MRKSFFILAMAMSFISILGLLTFSCEDACKDIDCGLKGICQFDGSCMCNAGYEIDAKGKCETEGRAKFIGVWRGTDNGSIAKPTYDLTIAASSINVETVRLTNFANSNCPQDSQTVATAKVVKGLDGKHISLNTVASDCPGITSVDAAMTLSLSADAKVLTVNYKFTVTDSVYYNFTDVLTKQ
jgi:hypothetical protein